MSAGPGSRTPGPCGRTPRRLQTCLLPRLALLTLAAGAAVPGGCSPDRYHAQADRDAYAAIDRQWQDAFGPREGYHLPDVDASVAQPPPAQPMPLSGTLTLAQAVGLALDHNRQYQLEKELLYLAGLNETLVAHRFAPHWLAGAGPSARRDRATGSADQWTAGVDGSLLGSRVLSTGATVTTEMLNGWLNVLTGDGPGGFHSLFSVAFSQPLLRGLGRTVAMEALTQAQRETLYQVRAYNRFRQVLVVQVVAEYYRVLQAQDAERNALAHHAALEAHVGRMTQLADAGRVARFELQQAQQDLVEAWDTLVQARQEHQTLLDLFKQTLGVPTAADLELDPAEMEALRRLGVVEPDLPAEDVVELALAQRLDLANRQDRVDDARRQIEVASDALRSDLSLVAAGGLHSASPAASLGGMDFDDTASLGLRVDAPIDRLIERNAYRAALITLAQRRREYEEGAQLVTMEVRQALRDLEAAAQRHRALNEALALARTRAENTTLLLQYGRAGVRDVLDAQEDLYDTRDEATAALVDCTVAVLNLYRDTGVLHVRENEPWRGPQGRPGPVDSLPTTEPSRVQP